ncbi:membrane protein [Pelistega indica]|uniref:Membrane protein n=1 Tax=Pelistega indica TaxID=1414851 RepID=V8G4Y9_9BURK|nr:MULTISPECIES: DUF3025 domain-containing protein [Pelistega]ETD70757.1 membrane protein [Pelistega indica]
MPLSSLKNIQLKDAYWQGWESFLHTIPTLVSSEGAVANYLNTIRPAHFSNSHSFVPQACLPTDISYESFIYQYHQIPTRDGLHDFFNALCWFHFPKTKAHFNYLHQQQIEHLGTRVRGAVRDTLTVFDENGFLIQCPDELWTALKAKEWQKAFCELRPLWAETKVMVFGHALLEKLVTPYKSITAHAIRIPSTIAQQTSSENIALSTITQGYSPKRFTLADIKQIDKYLTSFLQPETLSEKPYIPIQIFGIPNWMESQDEYFYADSTVFRHPKHQPNKKG